MLSSYRRCKQTHGYAVVIRNAASSRILKEGLDVYEVVDNVAVSYTGIPSVSCSVEGFLSFTG